MIFAYHSDNDSTLYYEHKSTVNIYLSLYHGTFKYKPMLTTSESLNLCDLYKIDMPQEIRDQQKSKSIKQAFKLLIFCG